MTGWLDVTGGHRLRYTQVGTGAAPAIWLHGGPGGGMHPGQAALFDPDRYTAVLFDQRGCGQSQPHAAENLAALEANTTADLIADIEALRAHLGIARWLVGGGSFGSFLAMTYAQAYPERVTGLVLAGVASSAPRDLHWLYGEVGAFFPEAFHAFCAHVDAHGSTQARLEAYRTALAGPDAQAAADAWCTWEMAIFGGHWDDQPGSRYADPAFRLGFARLCAHYFAAGCFVAPDLIEANMDRIAHIPGVMIHARFDPSAPLRTPWLLDRMWPAATLEILPGNAHSALSAQMQTRIRAATDRMDPFAGQNAE
ncbi:MAG: alpha/beta fold hydrolase [Pseudomonadota bacterium]